MLLRDLAYAGLGNEALLTLQRKRLPAVCCSVLMYHDIDSDDVDIEAWTVVRASEFLRQVSYLARHYELVSIDQAVMRMERGHAGGRPMAVITFDDGGSGNASVLLPIVESLKLPITIYVATRQVMEEVSPWFDQIINAVQVTHPVTIDLRLNGLGVYLINRVRGPENWMEIQRLLQDLKSIRPSDRPGFVATILDQLRAIPLRANARVRPMTVSNVKALAACPYVTLGAHSHCHSILTQLSLSDAADSVMRSKKIVENWSGREANHFAYPNGSFNDAIAKVVAGVGFQSATTTDQRIWERGDSLYRIPRISVGRYDSLAKFKVQLLGGTRRLLTWGRLGGQPKPCIR